MNEIELEHQFKKWLSSKAVKEQEDIVIELVQEIIVSYRVAIKNGEMVMRKHLNKWLQVAAKIAAGKSHE